jgi:hypothetical protein
VEVLPGEEEAEDMFGVLGRVGVACLGVDGPVTMITGVEVDETGGTAGR